MATPDNSDEESGDAFTDGDFEDSDEETVVERNGNVKSSQMPVNEAVNEVRKSNGEIFSEYNANDSKLHSNGIEEQPKINGVKPCDNGHKSDVDSGSNIGLGLSDMRRDSHVEQNPSIVGILGDQHNHVCIRFSLLKAHKCHKPLSL